MVHWEDVARRNVLAGLGATALLGAISLAGASSADADLPAGARRGRAVGVENGMPIYEVLGADGKLAGYALSATSMAVVRKSAQQLGAEEPTLATESAATQARGIGIFDVAKCAAAITWFAAQTVLPSVKLARVAAKLAGMVKKYGVKKVASVLTRWRKSKDRNIESDLKDLALALSGVGTLSVCVG